MLSMSRFGVCAFCFFLLLFSNVSTLHAGTVIHTGTLGGDSGAISNGYIVAGTFAPGFDPHSYKYVYGIDWVGNMDKTNYSQAVSDGNFRPIGNGTWTEPFYGEFYGVGSTSDSSQNGQKIFLFGFDTYDPDESSHFVLCTSSGWIMDTSTTQYIDASSANEFVFGSSGGSYDIMVQGFPIPEPTVIALLLSSGFLLLIRPFRK